MVWLSLGTKPTWLGLEKIMFWLKIPIFVATNAAKNRPEVYLKISSGVTLTNAETRSQTVVAGLAVFSPITPPPSPPPLHVEDSS